MHISLAFVYHFHLQTRIKPVTAKVAAKWMHRHYTFIDLCSLWYW